MKMRNKLKCTLFNIKKSIQTIHMSIFKRIYKFYICKNCTETQTIYDSVPVINFSIHESPNVMCIIKLIVKI